MASVYVLYTGGTIGSVGNPLAPMSGPDFAALLARMPGLANGQVKGYDITYVVDYTPTPLDSSNLTPADWVDIAQQVAGAYESHDGFVVLHGTDTMAFTASALSFFFAAGLSKPIILTGSQLPLAFTLNDALPNVVASLVLAGTTKIPEVCLYFDSLLLRGNRSVKVNANQFAGFDSPNFPPLATVGTEITIDSRLILPPPGKDTLSDPANLRALRAQLDEVRSRVSRFSVIALLLYPGISASTVSAVLKGTSPKVAGVVIEAFGEGNGPSNPEFLQVLTDASNAGVVLMDNTQVLTGSVNISAYATGSGLAKAGAISALDMTPEASMTKMVYLFGTGAVPYVVLQTMQLDLRGEITESSKGTTSLPVA